MGTIFDREHEPPEPGVGDTAYTLVRAVIDIVPGANDLLGLVLAPPLARRQQEWMNDLAAAVRRLEAAHGVTPEQLRDNPGFIDAVLTASQAAIRTSQHGKREALRNAVLNSGLPNAPEVAVQQLFIGLIDRFTEWHLRILMLFHDPAAWRSADGRNLRDEGSLRALLEQAYPELRGKRSFYDLVWADLSSAGLHNSGGLHVMMTSAMAKRTSELGDSFIRFITDPFKAEI